MPRYQYKCPNCSHLYIEQRTAEESQYITTCNRCGQAEYTEVTND